MVNLKRKHLVFEVIQSQRQKQVARSNKTKQILDWSADTILVNGRPLIIIFPDENKPLVTS